ncbi:hypothetical protein WDU94_006288 [Cyamophila willieti]
MICLLSNHVEITKPSILCSSVLSLATIKRKAMDFDYDLDYNPNAEIKNCKSVSLYNQAVKAVAENFVCYERKDLKNLPGHILFDVYYAVSYFCTVQE